jgi:hypothetical protein
MRAIDRLFTAWWARDFAAFQQPFRHRERVEPFDARSLFDAHFAHPERRIRGEMLFSGATVAVQIITPKDADLVRGICGGYAIADLFLVRFFPGLETPVVDEVRYLDTVALAESEWRKTKPDA